MPSVPTAAQRGEPILRNILVSPEYEGTRLDVFLATHEVNVSRSAFERLIKSGHVTVNGEIARPALKLKSGDVVSYEVPPPEPSTVAPQDIPLDIVYEDEHLVVVNKPKGMVTHPAPGVREGTLVNALLAHCKGLSCVGGAERPGIVHRLDKETSGLIVVAKNDAAHWSLQKQIQQRTAVRKYLALVWGEPKFEELVVDAPIGRHPTDRTKMAVLESPRYRSRMAVTNFKVLERFGSFALVEARLQTGRTHQVRVHCAYIHHPVVGDSVYSSKRRLVKGPKEFVSTVNQLIADLKGQALHAYFLSFEHPQTGRRLEFTAPMPEEMQRLLDYLRSNLPVRADQSQ